MKVAVLCLLSLVCLQATFATAAYISESDSRVLNSDKENKNDLPLPFFHNYLTADFGRCIEAINEVQSLAQKGWRLFVDIMVFSTKAAEGRRNCQQKIPESRPDELRDCLKDVEEESRKTEHELYQQAYQLIPHIKKAATAVINCLF